MSIRMLTEGFQPTMCCGPLVAPISILGASITPLQIIGGVFSIASAFSGAGAQQADNSALQQQLNAQAAANDYNARVDRENAQIAESQTAADVQRQEREKRLRAGANVAKAGASGLGIDSALDILSSNAAQEELDILTIKQQGLLQQRGLLQQASLDEASAANTRNQIPLVKASGKASRTASILGGVSKGLSVL